MRVFSYHSKINSLSPSVLILGAFDAIHNGHLELIKLAKKTGLPISITVFKDFDLIPSKQIKWSYTSIKVKLDQLNQLGIENVIIISFKDVKNLSGEEFIKNIVKLTNCKQIIVGQNFAYGKNRHNNTNDLISQFPLTKVIKNQTNNNQIISTTFLKQLIFLGEVDTVLDFAPFPYTVVKDIVSQDNQHNFELQESLEWLHPGVYAILIKIANINYWGVLSHTNNQSSLIIPDFKNDKYQIIPCQISFIHQVRPILNLIDKTIDDKDVNIAKKKLIEYLKKHH